MFNLTEIDRLGRIGLEDIIIIFNVLCVFLTLGTTT